MSFNLSRFHFRLLPNKNISLSLVDTGINSGDMAFLCRGPAKLMDFDRKNAFSLRVYTASIYRFRSVFPIHTQRPEIVDAQRWNTENNASRFLVQTNTIGLRCRWSPLLTVRSVFDRFSARWAKNTSEFMRLQRKTYLMSKAPENYWGTREVYHDSHRLFFFCSWFRFFFVMSRTKPLKVLAWGDLADVLSS